MPWEVEFIQWLQNGESSFFDYFFYFITQFGTELLFGAVAAVLYWCYDKRVGYRFLNVYMMGQLSVGVLKSIVKRPRPYMVDGVKSIFEKTGGYSFPSGHSNSIANIGTQFAYLAHECNNKRFKQIVYGVFVPLILLVMFSRIYLGQHFVTDTLVGAAVGVLIGIVASMLFDLLKDKEEMLVIGIFPLCVIVLVIFCVIMGMGADANEDIFKVIGIYSAFSLGYFFEKKYVCYNVRSDKKYKYIVKVAVGIVVMLLLKELLKLFFSIFEMDGIIYQILNNVLRYFLIGIWISLLAPMLFKKINW